MAADLLILVLSFTPAPFTHSSGKEVWPELRDDARDALQTSATNAAFATSQIAFGSWLLAISDPATCFSSVLPHISQIASTSTMMLRAGDFAGGGFGQHGAQQRVHLLAARRFQNEVIAVIALEADDGRRGGAEDANAFVARLFEPAAEFARPGKRFIQLLAADNTLAMAL